MDLYATELADAKAQLEAMGRNADDFVFDMDFLPPYPDGGGMFTVQYEVRAENKASGEVARFIGGIGIAGSISSRMR